MKRLIEIILKPLIHWAYPQFRRQKGYATYRWVFKEYFVMQKILGFNRSIPWPVHFTSVVIDWKKIEKGICCDPGDNRGTYINASGGLHFGNNVNMGPNLVIVTTNHDKYDDRKTGFRRGVTIGDNVWIGANCVITAGVSIGDNVTIGAGCVIRKNIPSNVTVFARPDSLEMKPKRDYEWDCTKDELM
ncbi:MAG: acyltransferase [Dysgonamonadaceae bacterium]|jgi:acetyltransferase-like isoleucine patch superfamily enzyme|nr:acyltransferase [Dysgonamonadaceae bacterium]